MDTAKYKKLFLEEAREHLKRLGEGFVRLEAEPDSRDEVDEIFRHAHSMKGMAGSMGYEPLAALSHAMEGTMDMVRKRTLQPGKEVMDLFFRSLETLEKMTAEVEEMDRTVISPAEIIAAFRAIPTGSSAPQASIDAPAAASPVTPAPVLLPPSPAVPAERGEAGDGQASRRAAEMLGGLEPGERLALRVTGGTAVCYVEIRISEESMAPAARGFIILSRLARAGTLVRSVPTLQALKTGVAERLIRALVLFTDSPRELVRTVQSVPEVSGVEVLDLTNQGIAEAEVMVSPSPAPSVPKPASASPEPPHAASAPAAKEIVHPKTVRVDTIILDRLINLIGELITSQERLRTGAEQIEDEELLEEVGNLGGLIRTFQETIMGVRMMPLDLVAGRYPRVIRDLARAAGKEIVFRIEGLDIELDRAILEEIGEVLVHVLRNAVDHGIESPEERVSAGKARSGSIFFRAYREKDWVYIQVGDDGRGVDLDKLRAKALAMGLVTQGSLDGMDREALLMLTTVPGFSTADQVTELSGRGVGLDAVRTKVESLGGTLFLDSVHGRGTTVNIKIPLSLAIIRILMVTAGGQWYGLPLAHILRTVNAAPQMLRRAGEDEYLMVGRSMIRYHRLAESLRLTTDREREPVGPVIVVEKGHKLHGYLIDEIIGTRDAVVKPLGQPLMKIPFLTGATVLGDGRPMILLDILRLP